MLCTCLLLDGSTGLDLTPCFLWFDKEWQPGEVELVE